MKTFENILFVVAIISFLLLGMFLPVGSSTFILTCAVTGGVCMIVGSFISIDRSCKAYNAAMDARVKTWDKS